MTVVVVAMVVVVVMAKLNHPLLLHIWFFENFPERDSHRQRVVVDSLVDEWDRVPSGHLHTLLQSISPSPGSTCT